MPAALPAVAVAMKGLTVAKLAAGAVMAGSAISAVGMITKSKTLQKIGGMTALVGGLGMGASALAGGFGGAAAGAGGAATGGSLFAKGANQLNAAAGAGGAATGGSLFAQGANQLNAAGAVTPAVDASSMGRVSEFFTKYNTTANILGGMAQGYGQYQSAKMQQEVPRKQLQLDQDKWDQRQANMGATSTIPNLRELQARQQPPGLLAQGVR